MSRYRKVDPRIWSDKEFRRFNDRGKLAFLFVLTHPGMTALGAMRASVAGLAAELGWPEKIFRDALKPAVEEHMVDVNEDALFIGLPNFLRYNEPEGPNSVKKAWPTALDLIPECDEKNRLVVRCRSYLDNKTQDFKNAIGDAIWDAFKMPSEMPCHILEPEPEREPEQEQETPCSPPKGTMEGFDPFWELYPKKVGKQGAIKAWKKLDPNNGLVETLFTALTSQKTSSQWTKEGGQFIPDPAKWLNGRRWEDQLQSTEGIEERTRRVVEASDGS